MEVIKCRARDIHKQGCLMKNVEVFEKQTQNKAALLGSKLSNGIFIWKLGLQLRSLFPTFLLSHDPTTTPYHKHDTGPDDK